VNPSAGSSRKGTSPLWVENPGHLFFGFQSWKNKRYGW